GASLAGSGAIALSDAQSNQISGVAAGATLTNVSETISGAGRLGAGKLTLVNMAGGGIDADGTVALVIDTGAAAIANAGLIKVSASGGAVVESALANTGTLAVQAGTLTLNGAVSGAGTGVIGAGILDAEAAFSQNVAFAGDGGIL